MSFRGAAALSIVLGLIVLTTMPAVAAMAPSDPPPSGDGSIAAEPSPPPIDEPTVPPVDPAPSPGGGIVDGVAGWAAEGVARAVITVVVAEAAQAAGAAVAAALDAVQGSTRPMVERGWFRGHYLRMVALGGVLALPFLLLAVVQALVRRSVGLLGRSVALLPIAGVAMTGALVVVDRLVAVTDGLCDWLIAGVGADLSALSTRMAITVTSAGWEVAGAEGAVVVPVLFAAVSGLLLLVAGVAVWIELVLRDAAVYVCCLFLPLTVAAAVWPAAAAWLRRLVTLLAAVIFSKFVIVAVIVIAAEGLASSPAGGFEPVLVGGALLLLAAFAPYVLLQVIPFAEVGALALLEGVTRRPTAAVGSPVRAGGMTRMTMSHVVANRVAARRSTAAAAPTAGRASAGGAAAGGTAAAATAVTAAARAPRKAADRAATAMSTTTDPGTGSDSGALR